MFSPFGNIPSAFSWCKTARETRAMPDELQRGFFQQLKVSGGHIFNCILSHEGGLLCRTVTIQTCPTNLALKSPDSSSWVSTGPPHPQGVHSTLTYVSPS
ncbi:unnamed protein product [Rangifer tarandus platyrhynchus]